MAFRNLVTSLLVSWLLGASVVGCGGSDAKTSSNPPPHRQPPAEEPLQLADCGPGTDSDKLVFNGTTYRQNTLCSTVVSAYYDASENLNVVYVTSYEKDNRKDPWVAFTFQWGATGDTGLFLAMPDVTFMYEDNSLHFCPYAIGGVNVTRLEEVGGAMAGDFYFLNLTSPGCNTDTISGSFTVTRQPDQRSGEGTQASPVPLTPGAAASAGRVDGDGVSNYRFVATATSHTVALTDTSSELSWSVFDKKANVGDPVRRTCDTPGRVSDQICTLSGLKVGAKYYLQVRNADATFSHYNIAID